MKKHASPVLGIDIGGVIIQKVEGGDTSFFDGDYRKTPAVHDVFSSIRTLVDTKFGKESVYIISKCGPIVQQKTLSWLQQHDFYQKTGVLPDHVYFCPQRKDKAPLCQQFGITHFIDDSMEVLAHLTSVKNLYLFQKTPSEYHQFYRPELQITFVESWPEILHHLLNVSDGSARISSSVS